MRMRFCGTSAYGTVDAPSSKSHTHRAIFMAALADGVSHISYPLVSDDTLRSIDIAKAMGAKVDLRGDVLTVSGGDIHAPPDMISAGNSGTAARFSMSVASLFDEEVTIDGDDSLRERPMGELTSALSHLGVKISRMDKLPITVLGPNPGGTVHISGKGSSQPVSSMLLASPMMKNGLEISLEEMVSSPYVEMTVEMMKEFGVDVRNAGGRFVVNPGRYVPSDVTIPGDSSSAAYLLTAGALAGRVTVNNLQYDSAGDMRIVNILEEMGSKIELVDGSVTSGSGRLCPIDLDMKDNPDLVPVLAVLMSVSDGTSIIRNVSHLRFKESDRIMTTVEMINSLGGNAVAEDDSIRIFGVDRLKGGYVNNHKDHRIMMAAAIASLVSDLPVVMDDCDCHSVSYPKFIEDIRTIGINAEVFDV